MTEEPEEPVSPETLAIAAKSARVATGHPRLKERMCIMKTFAMCSLLAVAVLWNTDASAGKLYGALLQDKYEIDGCYFAGQPIFFYAERTLEDCNHTKDLYVDDAQVIHHEFKCDVVYTPKNPARSKVKRSYFGEYQAKPYKERLVTRIVITDSSNLVESPDPACDLSKWMRLTKD